MHLVCEDSDMDLLKLPAHSSLNFTPLPYHHHHHQQQHQQHPQQPDPRHPYAVTPLQDNCILSEADTAKAMAFYKDMFNQTCLLHREWAAVKRIPWQLARGMMANRTIRVCQMLANSRMPELLVKQRFHARNLESLRAMKLQNGIVK